MPDPLGPTEHLFYVELACHDGTDYPRQWRQTRLPVLAREFEVLRAMCGNRPIPVDSAYRTPAYNSRVGGARNSQHCEGRALDCRPPKGMALSTFYQMVKLRASQPASAIRGIGKYAGFVHFDVRPTETLAVWSGERRPIMG